MADTPHNDTAVTDTGRSADDLIRSVMVAQKREVSRNALPDLEPLADCAQPVQEPPSAQPASKPKRSAQGGLKARVLAYRPTKPHIFWAVLALIVVLRPWLIPGILFLCFCVAIIAWLTVGPDRITELLASGWEKLSRRKPALADKLRARADRFALKFDALLDRLPDSWAEKLALPDFSEAKATQNTLDELPDPFDKLKPMPDVYRG